MAQHTHYEVVRKVGYTRLLVMMTCTLHQLDCRAGERESSPRSKDCWTGSEEDTETGMARRPILLRVLQNFRIPIHQRVV
jgi:hypothetical protein